MYRVTAYFKNKLYTQSFSDMYDAIDYKDDAEAHYASKVKFEKVFDMREVIFDSWNAVMNAEVNPLRHIPDLQVRHMVLQVLAWMWCIVFSMYMGSLFVMGLTMVAHALILAAIVVTVGTFQVAKTNPTFFSKPVDNVINSRAYGGEHE